MKFRHCGGAKRPANIQKCRCNQEFGYSTYQKWCIQKRCITMPRLTSRCPNCNAINIRRAASQNERETSIFRTFSWALRWTFVALQIGGQEVSLRVVSHLFTIHHFLVRSMVKYLIGGDVLMWFFDFCQEKPRNRGGSNRSQHKAPGNPLPVPTADLSPNAVSAMAG